MPLETVSFDWFTTLGGRTHAGGQDLGVIEIARVMNCRRTRWAPIRKLLPAGNDALL